MATFPDAEINGHDRNYHSSDTSDEIGYHAFAPFDSRVRVRISSVYLPHPTTGRAAIPLRIGVNRTLYEEGSYILYNQKWFEMHLGYTYCSFQQDRVEFGGRQLLCNDDLKSSLKCVASLFSRLSEGP
jgi:hypothetical protein